SPRARCSRKRLPRGSRSLTTSDTSSSMGCCTCSGSTMRRTTRRSAWRRSRRPCSAGSEFPIRTMRVWTRCAPDDSAQPIREMNDPPQSDVAAANGYQEAVARDPARRSWWRDLWRYLRRSRNGDTSIRDTLEELIERHEEDELPLDPAERLLLENTLKLRTVCVDDVSVPRADIVAVECETPLREVISIIAEKHHSRLPVYRKDLDDVLGCGH